MGFIVKQTHIEITNYIGRTLDTTVFVSRDDM